MKIFGLEIKKSWWPIIIFNLVYILIFTVYYLKIKDYEFLWYIGIMVFFFVLIITTIHKSKFDLFILWGLSIWGLLHMAGGGLLVNGAVLYKFQIIHLFGSGESFILKFDQVVHAYGFAITTFVAYHILKPYFYKKEANWKVIYPVLVLISMGLGALNEIAEFLMVVLLPKTGVGGYYNTMLDTVFNTIGAIIAVVVIHFRRKKEEKNSY